MTTYAVATNHPVLTPPLSEVFHYWTDGQYVGRVKTFRSGPDRLPGYHFDGCPWSIRSVAYWYRDHTLCGDDQCQCRSHMIHHEGICALQYTDGTYHLLQIEAFGHVYVFDWDAIAAHSEKMSRDAVLEALRRMGAGGVLIATSEAMRHGEFAAT